MIQRGTEHGVLPITRHVKRPLKSRPARPFASPEKKSLSDHAHRRSWYKTLEGLTCLMTMPPMSYPTSATSRSCCLSVSEKRLQCYDDYPIHTSFLPWRSLAISARSRLDLLTRSSLEISDDRSRPEDQLKTSTLADEESPRFSHHIEFC